MKGNKMKPFKKFVESYETVNEAEYNKEWWDSKSDSFKKRYIERHPNSIYAQKSMERKASSPKTNTSVKSINSLLKNKSAAEKDFETASTVLLDHPKKYDDAWTRKVVALAQHPYTPESVIKRMEKEQPYAALHSPKASKEFLDYQARNLSPLHDFTWIDILVQNPNLSKESKALLKQKLNQAIKDVDKIKKDPAEPDEEMSDWNKNWYKNRFQSQLDMLEDNK